MPYSVAFVAAAVIAAPAVQASQAKKPAPPIANPITEIEFTSRINAQFSAFDTNNDGRLDRAEIAAAQSSVLQQRAAAQQQRLEARFKQLDTSKDNQLSLAEFRALTPPVRAGQTAEQQLSLLDSNNNGSVSAEEFRAAPLDRFDTVDADDDGVITPAERRLARQRR